MKIKTQDKIYSFRTIIEPEVDGGYHGYVPLLTGLHTQGESLREVKRNLREAIKCHIEGLLMDKEEIPRERDVIENIESFSTQDFTFA
jgi:predicted RNase H-like HicB family nuclease